MTHHSRVRPVSYYSTCYPTQVTTLYRFLSSKVQIDLIAVDVSSSGRIMKVIRGDRTRLPHCVGADLPQSYSAIQIFLRRYAQYSGAQPTIL